MTTLQWILFFLLIQIIHFVGTWKLYKTAGYNFWHALIPIYNGIYNENYQTTNLVGNTPIYSNN